MSELTPEQKRDLQNHNQRSRGPKGHLENIPWLQDKICDCIRNRVPITHIYRALKIKKTLHYIWMKKGKKELRGVYRDFYDAVEQAKTESRDELKVELEEVLYVAMTRGQKKRIVKTARIMSLTRDQEMAINEALLSSPELAKKFDAAGILVKQEVQEIEQPPDVGLAFKYLSRKFPDEYGGGS